MSRTLAILAVLTILAVGSPAEDRHSDVALELDASNFDEALRVNPAKFVVVEFFASWCPACRNYKPHYEKVARLFNGPDAVYPGLIIMARVDCASKANTDLCDRFSVFHFPLLLWGPPSKFVSASWDPKKKDQEIKSIDDARTADRLLKWINKQLGSSFNFSDERYEISLPSNASHLEEVTQAIYDVEETTAISFDIIMKHKMIKSDNRAVLIKFLQLLVVHHPSKRCRRGSSELLTNFDELWPSNYHSLDQQVVANGHEKSAMKTFQICGAQVPRGYWKFCQGSRNDTRGFSCGLWVLLHSLSVRVGDGESHLVFTSICDFIHNFFLCDECREHFYQMCSRVSVPFNTTKGLTLWLWSTHNKVNERLRKEEMALRTGDPEFPKMAWPPKQLCPSCYLSLSKKSDGTIKIDWDKDEVFKFLAENYGKKLISAYEDPVTSATTSVDESLVDDLSSSGHAVTVPIGAAFGIALASCAFGLLAWWWRMHQKNRKVKIKTGAEAHD